jgi:type II secretion system protein G
MKNLSGSLARKGFTLIEILVVLILLAILAAAVFPVLTQQTDDADPVRVANDLSSIKTGVQTFRLDLRPEFPGDLEDLAHAPATATERSADGTVYGTTLPSRWNGPYIDAGLTAAATAQVTGNAIATGFGAQIQNEIVCFDRAPGTNAATGSTCVNGTHSVALRVTGLSADMFNRIDEVIDGTASDNNGNFRYVGGDAYYFLSPYH